MRNRHHGHDNNMLLATNENAEHDSNGPIIFGYHKQSKLSLVKSASVPCVPLIGGDPILNGNFTQENLIFPLSQSAWRISGAGKFPVGWTGKLSFPIAGEGNFSDDYFSNGRREKLYETVRYQQWGRKATVCTGFWNLKLSSDMYLTLHNNPMDLPSIVLLRESIGMMLFS